MLVLRTSNFQGATIRAFFTRAADNGPPRMSTIALRDQFKPIRIGENLVVNYKG